MRKKMSLVLITLLLSGCALTPPGAVAIAKMYPTAGSQTKGTVVFYNDNNTNMRVVANISGLKPGLHGFHVHENGDCSDPQAMRAGGHYNPDGQPHGHFHAGPHHAGDMPNLNADAQGNATLSYYVVGKNFSQSGFENRSMIIHAGEDDYHSQPAGNSGDRIACGVIKKIS